MKRTDEHLIDNPKLAPHPPSNTAKDPDEWVSGEEPMTGAQASYLKDIVGGDRRARRLRRRSDQGGGVEPDRRLEGPPRRPSPGA